MIQRIRIALFLLLFMASAHAVQEVELRDSADEPRFMKLSTELRCMVCQNQSIADSNADLAKDFRNQVKEKINQGQSNQEIVDYMVQRYGDYILYRPPFNAATALLWTGPFILIIIGLIIVLRVYRRQGEEDTADESMQSRQAQLKVILDSDPDGNGQ